MHACKPQKKTRTHLGASETARFRPNKIRIQITFDVVCPHNWMRGRLRAILLLLLLLLLPITLPPASDVVV